MRVLVLCGAFVLGVVAWACYTAGPWPSAGPVSLPPAATGTGAESPVKATSSTSPQGWYQARWVVASEGARPVLARGGRYVRRVSGGSTSSAVPIKPVSSRRRKVQQGAVAQGHQAPSHGQRTAEDGTVPPAGEQAEWQLAQEFFAQVPQAGAPAAEQIPANSEARQVEATPPKTASPPLQVVGPGAVEVILSLTDRFRNSVLRGSVFDPTGDPEQVEALSRELVQTIQELQAQQPTAEAVVPASAPEAAGQGIAVAPVPPGELDPEHEVVVRALREAARHLEEAANDLEWSARYHLADLLRETASELRHRAREFQPPRD